MGDITSYLLPLGYALEVNIEMESITVGGGAMGFGLEVNSHKSGFFQETVEEVWHECVCVRARAGARVCVLCLLSLNLSCYTFTLVRDCRLHG